MSGKNKFKTIELQSNKKVDGLTREVVGHSKHLSNSAEREKSLRRFAEHLAGTNDIDFYLIDSVDDIEKLPIELTESQKKRYLSTPFIRQTDDKPLVCIPSYTDLTSNYDSLSDQQYRALIQYAAVVHEVAGHYFHTDQEGFEEGVQYFVKNVDAPRSKAKESRKYAKHLYNSIEDGVIEHIVMNDNHSGNTSHLNPIQDKIAQRLEFKNKTIIARRSTKEETKKNVTATEAIGRAAFDLTKYDTGILRRLLDDNDTSWQFESQEDKNIFENIYENQLYETILEAYREESNKQRSINIWKGITDIINEIIDAKDEAEIKETNQRIQRGDPNGTREKYTEAKKEKRKQSNVNQENQNDQNDRKKDDKEQSSNKHEYASSIVEKRNQIQEKEEEKYNSDKESNEGNRSNEKSEENKSEKSNKSGNSQKESKENNNKEGEESNDKENERDKDDRSSNNRSNTSNDNREKSERDDKRDNETDSNSESDIDKNNAEPGQQRITAFVKSESGSGSKENNPPSNSTKAEQPANEEQPNEEHGNETGLDNQSERDIEKIESDVEGEKEDVETNVDDENDNDDNKGISSAPNADELDEISPDDDSDENIQKSNKEFAEKTVSKEQSTKDKVESELKQEFKELERSLQKEGTEDIDINELEINSDPDGRMPGDSRWKSITKNAKAIKRILSNQLQNKTNDKTVRGQRSGEPDPYRLHAISARQTDIMTRRHPGTPTNYHVTLILDRSISMGATLNNNHSRIEAAEEVISAYAIALEDLGISVSILDLHNNTPRIIKPSTTSVENTRNDMLTKETKGSTPLGKTMKIAKKQLEYHSGEEIIIPITDGRPTDKERYEDVTRNMNAVIMSITIDTEETINGEKLYDYHENVESKDGLKEKLIQISRRINF